MFRRHVLDSGNTDLFPRHVILTVVASVMIPFRFLRFAIRPRHVELWYVRSWQRCADSVYGLGSVRSTAPTAHMVRTTCPTSRSRRSRAVSTSPWCFVVVHDFFFTSTVHFLEVAMAGIVSLISPTPFSRSAQPTLEQVRK